MGQEHSLYMELLLALLLQHVVVVVDEALLERMGFNVTVVVFLRRERGSIMNDARE